MNAPRYLLRASCSLPTLALVGGLALLGCGGGTQPVDSGPGGHDGGADTGGGGDDVVMGGDDVVTMDMDTGTGGDDVVSMDMDSGGGGDDVVTMDMDSGTGGDDSGGGGSDSGGGGFTGLCAPAGSSRTPPATLQHVIMILMENKSLGSVMGSAQAPYINSVIRQCGTSDHFLDNVFGSTDLVSEPHYLALTSGSNCDTGVTPSGTNCRTTDAAPSGSNMLHTRSIFQQVSSWRAYQENMGSACNGSSTGDYAPKHNPPVFYTMLAGSACTTNDVSIPEVHCPTTVNTVCSTPTGAFAHDLANDTLPAYSFVTPGLINDMHDGTVSQGDNWLHTYLPLIAHSPAYMRGEVAVYVMWDEAGSAGQAQPNIFISPYTPPTASHTTMNLFSVLHTVEEQLGITTFLGCASGTAPGGGTCPSGSSTSLRHEFNF